jgi:hypothetical protein
MTNVGQPRSRKGMTGVVEPTGMETDAVPLRFGQTARIGLAAKTLRVLH